MLLPNLVSLFTTQGGKHSPINCPWPY